MITRFARLFPWFGVATLIHCGARTGMGVTIDDGLGDAGSTSDASPESDAATPSVDARVAASLDGLRWELPCTAPVADPAVCKTPSSRSVSATMGGTPGVTYQVTLRFRGVVEISQYDGGSNDGAFWQIGGALPAGSTINVYGLGVRAPAQSYYLNRGVSERVVVSIDYTETIPIMAGATVTLGADSRDSLQLRNLDHQGMPVVVPGVSPAPAPFDGQFIQMDVVDVQ